MHTLAKKFASVVKTGVPALLMAGLLFSCSKESFNTGVKQDKIQVTDKNKQKKILAQAEKMPAIGFYNKKMGKVIVFEHLPNGKKNFTFTNPPGNGVNFATSNGGQWTWSEEGGLVIITEPGQGFGGGGTVVAGNTVLDIAFAICFAVGDEAFGDMFDTGIDEVAGVIGIAGDFEALINGDFDEDDDFTDFFHGFAYYLVYAEQLANQSYEVLNWIDDLDQDPSDLDGFGFAFVVAFQNEGGIYLSKDGDLTINGGSIGFNGNYYGIEGLGFFDDEDGDVNFVEVPGFGTMGCE